MIQLRHPCPRCEVNADFVMHGWEEYSPMAREEWAKVFDAAPELLGTGVTKPPGGFSDAAYQKLLTDLDCVTACSFATCPHCTQKTLFVVAVSTQFFGLLSQSRIGFVNKSHGLSAVPQAALGFDDGRVLFTYPESMRPTGHPSWRPEKARKNYVSARTLHQQQRGDDRNPAAVVDLLRTSLDVATRELGATTGTLHQRIEALQKSGKLTTSLAVWGQRIRLFGNDANHEPEDDLTDAEADEAFSFFELFMRVCFEIPAEILARSIAPSATPSTGQKP